MSEDIAMQMDGADAEEVYNFLLKLSEYDCRQDRELETMLGFEVSHHSEDYYAIHAVVFDGHDIELNFGRTRVSPIELDLDYHPWYGYLFVDGFGHASVRAQTYLELSEKFVLGCRKICEDIKNPKGWNQRVG